MPRAGEGFTSCTSSALLADDSLPEALAWYVVRTKAGAEERALSNIQALDVEAFNPQLHARPGTRTMRRRSLFPRYIFARFGLSAYRPVRFARGVSNIVSIAGAPSPVDDEIVEAVRGRIGPDGLVALEPEFEPGDRVIVNAGPFRDVEGIFQRTLSDRQRVTILLSLVKAGITLTVPPDYLRKAL